MRIYQELINNNPTAMERKSVIKSHNGGIGGLINSIQTLFVASLRIWSIPIVLMLSVASGFTTYYGMSHFIIPWIALVITIAVQSIIVICSLEIAGIHWKANKLRYSSVLVSLLIAIAASITFSYFKFYEISQKDTIKIDRLNQVRQDVNDYLTAIAAGRSAVLKKQQQDLEKASEIVTQAYFGTHPEVPETKKNMIGEGPFFKYQNQLFQEKKDQATQVGRGFEQLNQDIRTLQSSINQLKTNDPDTESQYKIIVSSLNEVQIKFNQLASNSGLKTPEAPVLMSYAQFAQGITPSFSMWQGFSLFAFLCAAMVDFFTVLLSYRLEFTAPGPLSEREQELVFECLRQFTEFRINENDELEMVIEKSEIEKARRYSDWSRMFAVGFLLSRGFLRKIDARSVEFAPNLYPLIAERMGTQLRAIKAQSAQAVKSEQNQVTNEQ
jgi:gas vesicle GvpC-like protein